MNWEHSRVNERHWSKGGIIHFLTYQRSTKQDESSRVSRFSHVFANSFLIYIFDRSKYQLRLFCTSSVFYAGFSTFRTIPLPCPIEFPPTCEVRINTTPVPANLKGLKKRPGTAPPPDISSVTRLSGSNKVDMVYVNSQQPVQSKVGILSCFLSLYWMNC
jgi:hypothetical protein